MRIRILPYKQGSRSAKALAEALNARVLKLIGSTFKRKTSDVIINWGLAPAGHPVLAPGILNTEPCQVLNTRSDVQRATNKLDFFNLMTEAGHGDIIPPYWSNKNEVPEDQFPIVCRTILSGHSGAGIVLADGGNDLVDAPLYTKYIKKEDEYRVHVGKLSDGTFDAFATQRKARRLDHDSPNWRIRNHSNGFVFVRQGFVTPNSVTQVALTALEATGLDFGAIDILWNQQQQKAYVLEVNTAPGLEGQTVTDYANFFKGRIGCT